MANRLEVLRIEIDRLIMENQEKEARYFISHLYGVSHFCTLLAFRRGQNAELAAISGMLHDIYQITHSTLKKHAVKGAKVAKKILKAQGAYSDNEISLITTAISRHSDKESIHEPFDETLKDADVMSHSLYNPDFPVLEKEILRYKNIMMELGCKSALHLIEGNSIGGNL